MAKKKPSKKYPKQVVLVTTDTCGNQALYVNCKRVAVDDTFYACDLATYVDGPMEFSCLDCEEFEGVWPVNLIDVPIIKPAEELVQLTACEKNPGGHIWPRSGPNAFVCNFCGKHRDELMSSSPHVSQSPPPEVSAAAPSDSSSPSQPTPGPPASPPSLTPEQDVPLDEE